MQPESNVHNVTIPMIEAILWSVCAHEASYRMAWHAWHLQITPACLVDGKMVVVVRSQLEMRAGEEGGCGEEL